MHYDFNRGPRMRFGRFGPLGHVKPTIVDSRAISVQMGGRLDVRGGLYNDVFRALLKRLKSVNHPCGTATNAHPYRLFFVQASTMHRCPSRTAVTECLSRS